MALEVVGTRKILGCMTHIPRFLCEPTKKILAKISNITKHRQVIYYCREVNLLEISDSCDGDPTYISLCGDIQPAECMLFVPSTHLKVVDAEQKQVQKMP